MKDSKRKKKQIGKKMDRRTFITVSAKAVASAGIIAGFPAVLRGASPPEIKIGSIQPVSGPLAVIGKTTRQGNQLAVNEINRAGGIKSLGGAKLKLLLGDSESKPDVGRSEAERLIKEGAVAVIGPFQSGVAMAISTLCKQRKTPFVVDVGLAEPITKSGGGWVFRVFPTGTQFAIPVVKYLKQMLSETGVNIKKGALTTTGDFFGKAMSGLFLKHAKDLPFPIEEPIYYPLGTKELSTEIAKVKASKADILFSVARPSDAKMIVRELYKQRVPLKAIISPGSPGYFEPSFMKEMDKLAEYVLTNAPWLNPLSPKMKQVAKAYQNAYGGYMDNNSGYAYMGVMVLADAIRRAGSTDKKAIREALTKTNYKENIMVGGHVKFNEIGDNINATTAMIQNLRKNGKLAPRVVLPKNMAVAKYVFPAPPMWER